MKIFERICVEWTVGYLLHTLILPNFKKA